LTVRRMPATLNRLTGPVIKPAVFVLCLVPLLQAVLALFGVVGSLGANPVEELLNRAGIWGLNLLLITLCVTPLRQLTGAHALGRLRRMLGLFAFTYLCLHFTVYLTLDRALELNTIVEDVLDRPYITLGFTGFVALLPLAITSTNGMRRRLGRRWQQLHYLIYPIALLGVWHYFWQVKQDVRNPAIYAGLLAVLLGYRVIVRWRRRRSARTTRQVALAGRAPAGETNAG
jgi:sulfoxide reductase heme-binding subunit YedZ